jgi:hypothetical protein
VFRIFLSDTQYMEATMTPDIIAQGVLEAAAAACFVAAVGGLLWIGVLLCAGAWSESERKKKFEVFQQQAKAREEAQIRDWVRIGYCCQIARNRDHSLCEYCGKTVDWNMPYTYC